MKYIFLYSPAAPKPNHELLRLPNRMFNTGDREDLVAGSDGRGIDRAFDVIRNHTVHTKGYVMTALKVIEEYGNETEKALLADLLREKGEPIVVATSEPPIPKKKKPAKKK